MAGDSIRHRPLVFVDIETTGGSPRSSRILEVAAIRVEHNRIVGSYQSLIDPDTFVPAQITRLTGITNDDIITAPSFYKISSDLNAIMHDATFVAHNVNFDYSFMVAEFERLGHDFSPARLCTVRLSRRLFPQHRGHRLQDLIDRHQFEVGARHRAYDDAHVLWQFYGLIQQEFDLDTIDAALERIIKYPPQRP